MSETPVSNSVLLRAAALARTCGDEIYADQYEIAASDHEGDVCGFVESGEECTAERSARRYLEKHTQPFLLWLHAEAVWQRDNAWEEIERTRDAVTNALHPEVPAAKQQTRQETLPPQGPAYWRKICEKCGQPNGDHWFMSGLIVRCPDPVDIEAGDA